MSIEIRMLIEILYVDQLLFLTGLYAFSDDALMSSRQPLCKLDNYCKTPKQSDTQTTAVIMLK